MLKEQKEEPEVKNQQQNVVTVKRVNGTVGTEETAVVVLHGKLDKETAEAAALGSVSVESHGMKIKSSTTARLIIRK